MNTPRGVILVPGTHAALKDRPKQWHHPSSPFVAFLRSQGLRLADCEQFVWTTELDGVRWWPWQWFRKDDHTDWRAAGANFKRYLATIPFEDRNVLAHSHAGQLVFYSLRLGARIRRLVTIGTPVRKDMRDVVWAAKNQLFKTGGRWRHFYSPDGDRTQWLGSLQLNNLFGIERKFNHAENCPTPGAGHSRVLNDPEYFSYFLVRYHGLSTIDFLKGA